MKYLSSILILIIVVFAACTTTVPQEGDATKAVTEDKVLQEDTGATNQFPTRDAQVTEERVIQNTDTSSSGGGSSGGGSSTASSSSGSSSESSGDTVVSSSSSSSSGGLGLISENHNIRIGDSLKSSFGDLRAGQSNLVRRDTYTWQGQTYGWREDIYLGNENPSVQTALSGNYEKAFEDFLFMPIRRGDLKYQVTLSSHPEWNLISESNPLEIEFLGRDLKISDVNIGSNPSANSIVVMSGQEFFLDAGDSIVVNGRTITLVRTTGMTTSGGSGGGISSSSSSSSSSGGYPVTPANAVFRLETTANDGFVVNDVFNDEGTQYDSVSITVNLPDGATENIILDAGETYTTSTGTIYFEGAYANYSNETGGPAGSAIVDIDGQVEVIDVGEEIVINGLSVYFKQGYNEDGVQNDWAILVIGETSMQEFQTNDEFIGEDADDPAWVWDLESLQNGIIGIKWNLDLDTTDEDNPQYNHPLYAREMLYFPYGNTWIEFGSRNPREYADIGVELSTEDLMLPTGTIFGSGAQVLKIYVLNGSNNTGFDVSAGGLGTQPNELVDAIYLYQTNTPRFQAYYKEIGGNDVIQYAAGREIGSYVATLVVNGNEHELRYENFYQDNGFGLNATNITALSFAFGLEKLYQRIQPTNAGFVYLGGGDENTNTYDDLYYENGNVVRSLYNWDDARTEYGVRIRDPTSLGFNDELIIEVPYEQVSAEVSIEGYRYPIDTPPTTRDPLPDIRQE